MDIDTFMFVEATVLNRDDGVLHRLRDLLRLNLIPTLAKHPSKGRAVLIGDRRDARSGAFGKILQVRLHRFVRAFSRNAA